MSASVSSILVLAIIGVAFALALWYSRRASRSARPPTSGQLQRPQPAAARAPTSVESVLPVQGNRQSPKALAGSLNAEVARPVGPPQSPHSKTELAGPLKSSGPAIKCSPDQISADTVPQTWLEPIADSEPATAPNSGGCAASPDLASSATSPTASAPEVCDEQPEVAPQSDGARAGPASFLDASRTPVVEVKPEAASERTATPPVSLDHPHAGDITDQLDEPSQAAVAARSPDATDDIEAIPPAEGSKAVADSELASEPLDSIAELEPPAPTRHDRIDGPLQVAQSVVLQANVEAEAAIAGIVSIDRGETARNESPHNTTTAPSPGPDLRRAESAASGTTAMAVADPVDPDPAAAGTEPLVEANTAAAVDLPTTAADGGVAHVAPMEPEGSAELDVALQTMLDSDTANELAAAVMIGEDNLPRTDDSSAEASVRQTARPAVHRDRRGRPAAAQQPVQEVPKTPRAVSSRPPAQARLRLSIHPIRRTVQLALILMRPEEFPPRVTLQLGESRTVDALHEKQYGDVDLAWSADLLMGEIRLACVEGFQWVRSARPVHIFAADPAEPDLVTVASAAAGIEHTIVCRDEDAGTVCDLAESAGSARPKALVRFTGIADGWVVLTGYWPTRAAAVTPVAAFLPLDPGNAIVISLDGGFAIGPRSFAQGKPPRINVEPALDGVSVRIGGVEAGPCDGGGWEAPGWDAPGPHLIDVVPGPTLKYEIIADPAANGGWAFWDAHPDRAAASEGPWARARICGAGLEGPSGERVLAVEVQPTLLALGIDGSIASLQPRADVGVSVGLAGGTPAFLLVSSGRRRAQGKIVWLGLADATASLSHVRHALPRWVEAVRGAAARRLPVDADEEGVGESIWRKAVALARAIRRQRR